MVLYVPIPCFSVFFSPQFPAMYHRISALLLCIGGLEGRDMPSWNSTWQVSVNKHFLLLHFRVCIGSSSGVAFSSHSTLLGNCIESFLFFDPLIIAFFQQNDSLLLWIPCACYHSSVNKLAVTLAWHHLYYIFIVTDIKQDGTKETTCVSSFQQHLDIILSTLSTIFLPWHHSFSGKTI